MIIVYSSQRGTTRKVVAVAEQFLNCQSVDVKTNPVIADEVVVFMCPTYGDEELPHDMEDYLISLKPDSRKFVLCELGNYYGYDDYTFGAATILRQCLTKLGWQEAATPLSLDSFPHVNWEALEQWLRKIKNEI